MKLQKLHALGWSVISVAFALAGLANATPITANQTSVEIGNVDINSDNYLAGAFIRVGDLGVSPLPGTSGVAIDPLGGTHSLFNDPSVNNWFTNNAIPYSSNLLGTWTITLTNGVNTHTTMPSTGSVSAPLPFVNSVTYSGTNTNPSFAWSPPATLPSGDAINGYSVGIFDKSQSYALSVAFADLPASMTSYTFQPSDFANGT